MKNKNVKVNYQLSFLFTLAVLLVFIVTAILTGLLGYFLYSIGAADLLAKRNPLWGLTILLLASLTVSTLISFIGSKFTLRPVQMIINGINQLADGNFSIRLEKDTFSPQYEELITSFNLLATELDHTEILRGDFINSISHEFKTPIASIKGFAEMMKESDLMIEERNEYLDIIIDESSRLSKLSTSVLNLSKLENQMIVSDQSLVNISEQIRKNIILLQKDWENKKINLSLNIEDVDLLGNKEMLGQVWFNLSQNAVKFSSQSGDIIIALDSDDEKVIFTIVNEGSYISEEQLPYIFSKFYQGDTSHKGDGNGIGLALVKRIVELHNGIITCESNEYSGTSFMVVLPLK